MKRKYFVLFFGGVIAVVLLFMMQKQALIDQGMDNGCYKFILSFYEKLPEASLIDCSLQCERDYVAFCGITYPSPATKATPAEINNTSV